MLAEVALLEVPPSPCCLGKPRFCQLSLRISGWWRFHLLEGWGILQNGNNRLSVGLFEYLEKPVKCTVYTVQGGLGLSRTSRAWRSRSTEGVYTYLPISLYLYTI